MQHIGWEACFYVNVPVGAAALIMSLLVLKETPAAPAGSFDIPGIVALAAALFALIFGLIKGPDFGWASGRTLAFLGAAALLGLLFIVHESRARQPLLPLKLFRSASLSAGVVLVILLMFALFGAMFFMTFGTAVLGAIMSARIDSLLPTSWHAAHLPPLTAAGYAQVKSAISVGVAPVPSGTPAQVADVITQISHATFAAGMHNAFLVGAAVALGGAGIALITKKGTGTVAMHAGI